MKNYLVLFLFSIALMSCKNEKQTPKTTITVPEHTNTEKTKTINDESSKAALKFQSIKNDHMKWWIYYNRYIKLSYDFTAINHKNDTISKALFLKQLITGNYLPMKLPLKQKNKIAYKLFEYKDSVNQSIKRILKQQASHSFKLFRKEGQSFPKFNCKDFRLNL